MTICVLASLMLLSYAPAASANVLYFDDIDSAGQWDSVPIPNGYGGFSWSNFYVENQNYYTQGSGYKVGCISPDYVAFNGYGSPSLLSDGVFEFTGAYLTAAWSSTLNIEVQGYLGASLLYDTTVTVSNSAPTWCSFNYSGIDTLRFVTSDNTQFAMDNFTYTPEPATMSLLGLGALSLLRRKKVA